jgi:hypothetical protein
LLGDDDGGRLVHPFALPAIAAGKWELRLFPDACVAVMIAGNVRAIVKAGGFGAGSAGHSHDDVLSLVVGNDILIDSGTSPTPAMRTAATGSKGTGAHNTIRVDGLDQATAAGPFRWINTLLSWQTNDARDLEAECRYTGFTHRLGVESQKPDVFLVIDDINGPTYEHDIEQLWHLGLFAARSKLVLPATAELLESWRSTTFGEKHLSPLVRVRVRSKLQVRLEARIELNR